MREKKKREREKESSQQEQYHTLEEQHKLLRIANDENTDVETLLELSQSENEIIRGAVACNKNTPKFVIDKLLTDKSNHVRSVFRKLGINVLNNTTICVAGKNNIAVNVIKLLASEYSEYDICFIPDLIDSGIDTWQSSLKKAANELKLRQASLEELYEIEELFFISLEYSKLIDPKKFKSKNLFNIHFSLLPKYKGMNTSVLPILHGENYSGVTLHKIDNGIDTGEIIDQIEFSIERKDTARDLYFKYLDNGFTLIKNNLDKLINNNYTLTPQSTENSTYYSKKYIEYNNLKINYFKTAFQIQNQFRAFTFEEYQTPSFENWYIRKTEITTNLSKSKPGTKISENKEFFLVSTIDFDIKLFKGYKKIETGIKKVPNINLQDQGVLANNLEYFMLNNVGFDKKFVTYELNKKTISVSGVNVNKKFISPHYGSFSNISFSSPGSSKNYELIEGLLKKINNEYCGYEFTISPEFYGLESSLIVSAILNSGASIKTMELNNHIELKTYQGMNRANTKKLKQLKDKLYIAKQSSANDLRAIYDLLTLNREAKGHMLSLSFDNLSKLFNKFSEEFNCWAVYDAEDNLRAGAITIDMNKIVRYVFYWGDKIVDHDNLSPVVLLADHLIKQTEKKGFLYLDLGVSSINGIINPGLRHFKRSLGAVDSFKIVVIK